MMAILGSLFSKIGSGLGNLGQKTGGLASKLDLKVPESLDLGKSYSNNVLKTGNYALPTTNNLGNVAQPKPLGDYTFLKDASVYIPNTEFADKISNYKSKIGDKLQGAAQGAIGSLSNNARGSAVDIGVSFNPYMAQINPAQMVQANQGNRISDLYSRLMG